MLQSRIAALSDRELEVFRLIGEGHATRQIAEESAYQREDRGNLPGAHQGEASLRSARELIQHAIQWKVNEKALSFSDCAIGESRRYSARLIDSRLRPDP